jgi:hypothetical protein
MRPMVVQVAQELTAILIYRVVTVEDPEVANLMLVAAEVCLALAGNKYKATPEAEVAQGMALPHQEAMLIVELVKQDNRVW